MSERALVTKSQQVAPRVPVRAIQYKITESGILYIKVAVFPAPFFFNLLGTSAVIQVAATLGGCSEFFQEKSERI